MIEISGFAEARERIIICQHCGNWLPAWLNSLLVHYGKFWQNLSKKHFRVMQDSNLSHPEFLSAKAT